MSRYYELVVKTEGTTRKQLKEILIDYFGWEEDYLDDTEFVGKGNLCGGITEEEAHEQISKKIKELNLKAKVKTKWTYLEDLPYEEYGDDLE